MIVALLVVVVVVVVVVTTGDSSGTSLNPKRVNYQALKDFYLQVSIFHRHSIQLDSRKVLFADQANLPTA